MIYSRLIELKYFSKYGAWIYTEQNKIRHVFMGMKYLLQWDHRTQ